MDKLNITEGEWVIDHWEEEIPEAPEYTTIPLWEIRETNSKGLRIAKIEWVEGDNEKSSCNAKAIVTAVNNTYKKGINPEAVPDMHGALLEANKVLSKMNYNPDAKKINRLHHGIKLALKKAEL